MRKGRLPCSGLGALEGDWDRIPQEAVGDEEEVVGLEIDEVAKGAEEEPKEKEPEWFMRVR